MAVCLTWPWPYTRIALRSLRGLRKGEMAMRFRFTNIASGLIISCVLSVLLPISLEAQLKPFGYDIFRAQSEPITEGPIDDQFILSPGDQIIITVWGQLNIEYPLTVSEEGSINIPEEGGRIVTNGMSLRELKARVAERLARIYAAYINPSNPALSTAFVEVRLAESRPLLINVLGEVPNQGPYSVRSGGATLLNLLNNAGGVLERGSLREIKIRRSTGKVDIIDLYDFLITGNIDPQKAQIRSGDFIIVPIKAKTVTIQGEVKRPGIYEAVGAEDIAALVRFAGGLNANAFLDRAQVRRFSAGAGEKFLDINLGQALYDPNLKFVLQDGDEVTVYPNITVRKPIVEVQGSGIKRAGAFEFKPGMTVRDLIAQAEGLKEDVFLGRADLVRTADDFSKKLTIFSLQDLYKEEGPGRYAPSGETEKDFPLKELDVIMTYSSFEMKGRDKKVTITGHVKEPGTYVLAENMSLYDLVFSRGGYQDEAFRKKAYLDLAHIFRKTPGEIEEKLIPFNLGRLLTGDTAANLKLEPDDRIVVYSYETMKTKPFVNIEGLVINPGTYELKEGLTVEDLILIAGGLRPDAYRVEAVIGRTGSRLTEDPGAEASNQPITMVVPIEAGFAAKPMGEKTRLEIYDKINVRNLPDWEPKPVVTMEGQVVHPGSYTLKSRDERLSSVVERAGSLKVGGLAEGAVLYRKSNITGMTQDARPDSEKIPLRLDLAIKSPGGTWDLPLKDGDRVFVPYDPGSVEVKGAVNNPGFFPYKSGEGMRYYLKLAGGYRADADSRRTVAYLPNGMASPGTVFSGPEILSGSRVEVPFKEEAKAFAMVEVRGAVKNPLKIQFVKGLKLADYIEMCGGYREDADIGRIGITYLGATPEGGGVGGTNTTIAGECLIEVPFLVKDVETEGEPVVRRDLSPLAKAEIGDIEVRGAVNRPGLIRYRGEKAKLEDYGPFFGGYAEDADILNIVVHMPDGTKTERKGAKSFKPKLAPGCVVEVPAKPVKKVAKVEPAPPAIKSAL